MKTKNIFELMWEALQDEILIILIMAAAISITIGATVSHNPDVDWIEGLAILAAVIVVVLTTAINDYNKEQQFRALKASQVCTAPCFCLGE